MQDNLPERLKISEITVNRTKKRFEYSKNLQYTLVLAAVFVAFVLILISNLGGSRGINGGATYLDEQWVKYVIKPEREKTEREKERDRRMVEYEMASRSLTNVLHLQKIRRLPDVIGIGSEKCGSGALRSLMDMHPMIKPSLKEPHFFDTSKVRSGIKAYKPLLREVLPHELSTEKSPAYFNWELQIPSNIRKFVPNAKIFLVLCDPVGRTYSDYVQEIMMKHINKNKTFNAIVSYLLSKYSEALVEHMDEDSLQIQFIQRIFRNNSVSHVLTTGLYYYHLLRWFKVYNANEILIIDGEELISNPAKIMKDVQQFLKVPEFVLPEDMILGESGFYCFAKPLVVEQNGVLVAAKQKTKCMGGKGRTRKGAWGIPDPESMEKLRQFYDPFNQKLYKLLNRTFNW